jgi:tRNA A37 threonylcarbamoyladenosine dehydratase
MKSNTASLVTASLVSSACTASTIFLIQYLLKRKAIQKLRKEFSNALATSPTNKNELNEDFIREVLSRNYSFFGEEKMNKIRKSFVIVVGVGGVGSHAAHMLMRSGVGKIRIIDFDEVTTSSLNRHSVATKADIGKPKVIAMQEHFKEIYPFAKVEAKVALFSKDTADSLLEGNPDFVLDCIDNIHTKLDLIEYCVKNKINIISSTGAGAKCDPSRIQIADISNTKEDPLARATRKELRKRGIESGVPVVYSTEKPGNVKLLPLPEELYGKKIEGNPPNFRSRVLPVFGTVPALFGNAIATYVITKLADWPIKPLAIKLREATYIKLYKDYAGREQHVFNNSEPLNITVSDVGYIFEEIWNGRSALSGNLNKLTLTRWDRTQPPSLQNIICLTKAEAEKHDKLTVKPEEYYDQKFLDTVKAKFKEESELSQWRNI